MTDIRQSPQFANFMQDIGWKVEKIDSTFVYLRNFPLIGNFVKISRIRHPIPFSRINDFVKKNKIFRLKISPFMLNSDIKYEVIRQQFLKNGFKIENSPFNPTTTIQIDLTQTEEEMFNNFTSAKRKAVRRAIKNNIVVKESQDIESFIKIRKRQYFPMGFLMVKEMKSLWKNFYPDNAALLLAYQTSPNHPPFAGIFLLFYDGVAYYWYASSLPIGKKLFAPTLLTWEAIKLAKKRSCKIFDFEGIYDERFPKASESWRGFTKFKEGFGGEKVIFIENFSS